ncbi:MAG: hypothetical protein CME07_06880 [Gemmatimonadetes bacterium]|nr:hypothetical protein [Gemmatimonadota bacterium]
MRVLRRVLAGLFLACGTVSAGGPLEIRDADTPAAWIARDGVPIFAYGIGPQRLFCRLPVERGGEGSFDIRDFAEWAAGRGVTIVRGYPPSHATGEQFAELFHRAGGDPARFDLTRFHPGYFERLREACLALDRHGIFVHLQMWQAGAWKKEFADSYYHPDRNTNPALAADAGPGRFVIFPGENPALIAHQREHVRRFLDATGDIGNVFYDLMNEIGNGTGLSAEWVEAMLDEVDAWEARTGMDVLIGLNDEGRNRAEGGASLSNPRMELAFLDRGRYDRHLEVRREFGKPTLGVRNIEWDAQAKERTYFYGVRDLTVAGRPDFRARSRRMYWRMLMAKNQCNAGYADFGMDACWISEAPGEDFVVLADFAAALGEEFPGLRPSPEVVSEAPVPPEGRRALVGERMAAVFLEAAPGQAGVRFSPGRVALAGLPWPDGMAEVEEWDPRRGILETREVPVRGGCAEWEAGPFVDAWAAVVVREPAAATGSTAEPGEVSVAASALPELRAVADGQAVVLSWGGERGRAVEVRRGVGEDSLRRLAVTVAGRFRDETAPPGVDLRYRVVYPDGRASGEVRVRVPDESPDEATVRLHRRFPTAVILWATGVRDGDLRAAEWQGRNADGDLWRPLPGTGLRGVLLEDAGLPRGARRAYRVRWVDDAGNAGQWSAPCVVELPRPGIRSRARDFLRRMVRRIGG